MDTVKQQKDMATRSACCGIKLGHRLFFMKTRTLSLIRKSLTVFDASFMSGTIRTIMLLWKLKWGRATSSSHRHFTAISARPLYAFNEMTLLFFNFLCFQSVQNSIFRDYCSEFRGASKYLHFLLSQAFSTWGILYFSTSCKYYFKENRQH